MIQTPICEIEVLFGSKNRADFDALSDVDYLLADGDHLALAARKAALQRSGFSVSDYSLPRLRSIFRKRTLFAAHLKFEGRVIFDRNGLFQELVSNLDPHRDYKLELQEGSELFRPLNVIPRSLPGYMWALDHLAVSFRNMAIIDHARRGEFVFSHDQLLSNYGRWGEATSEELAALKRLRLGKKAYREGRAVNEAESTLFAALRAVESLFQPNLSAEFRTRDCLATLSTALNSTQAYVSLREIERELVSLDGIPLNSKASDVRTRLFRMVRDPHAYLWRAMHDSDGIGRQITLLRSLVY